MTSLTNELPENAMENSGIHSEVNVVSSTEGADLSTFVQALQTLEQGVQTLRSQYEQHQKIQALQLRLEEARSQAAAGSQSAVVNPSPPLPSEIASVPERRETSLQRSSESATEVGPNMVLEQQLQQLEQQLESLELQLRSELFGWGDVKEWCWQVLRYGGMGLMVGWGLAFYLIKNPVPAPAPASPNAPATSMPSF
ncbi:MAG: hypothetical protein VKJ24_15615 [Synechococcales bacterium]|nr:hypothetical protein [Synechococcales bacterium]